MNPSSPDQRPKQAHAHLQNIIAMIKNGRACMVIAQQLQAVGRAVSAKKKLAILDHLDHCLENFASAGATAMRSSDAKFKDITKYL